MKRALLISLAAITAALVAAGASYAQNQVAAGTPEVYKVTLNGLRLSTDGGTTWTLVNNASMEFDIASVNAGAAAGNYASGATIPPGTYNRLRTTIAATFKMQGYVYYAAGNRTYFTTAAGIDSVAGNVTDTSQMTSYGEQSILIPGYNAGDNLSTTDVADENVDFAISMGTSRKINVDFDVTNTLALYDDLNFYPAQPTVTQSIQ